MMFNIVVTSFGIVPFHYFILLSDENARPISADEEIFYDDFYNTSTMSIHFEDSVNKVVNDNERNNAVDIDINVEANLSGAVQVIRPASTSFGPSKKKSFVYTNQSIALNVATDNNAYINEAKDNDEAVRGCHSANVILVSNSRQKSPKNRIAFSAASTRSKEFLPEVTGDTGLALQSPNPKISFSNNHYNVQVCD